MAKIPKDLKAGIYQHYKGNYYQVIGLAHHSETLEKMVVYIPLYMSDGLRMFVRPAEMFFQNIEVDGKKIARFKYIGTQLSEIKPHKKQ